MTSKDLALWWEKTIQSPYVARRDLIQPSYTQACEPISQVTVGYCSAGFAQSTLSKYPGINYLILGEKEPMQDVEQPASFAADAIGGFVRKQVSPIIPLIEVQFNLRCASRVYKLDSDHVPLLTDYNQKVRILCGTFHTKSNLLDGLNQITLLDVVLMQGGTFKWQIPHGQRCFTYVLGGKVHFGTFANPGPVCKIDSWIWSEEKEITIRSQCEGGRFLLCCAPMKGVKLKDKYQVVEMPPLSFAAELTKEDTL